MNDAENIKNTDDLNNWSNNTEDIESADHLKNMKNVATTILKCLVSNMNDAEKENMNNHHDENFENTENEATTSQATSFISTESNTSGKTNGFNVVKDYVDHENNVIRRRTYVCQHSRYYESNSNKETDTKKMRCPWHINASCPKNKNPSSAVFINKVINEHNHELNIDAILFEHEKRFNKEMIDDIKFLTQHCRMGATNQRRYLEGFDRDRQNILLVQRLVVDKSKDSHVWFFKQILKATNIQPTVILTDSDPAIDAAAEIIMSDAEEDHIDSSKVTIQQLLDVVEQSNVNKIWEIKIGNSLKEKYYIQQNNKPITYLYAIDKEKIDHAKQRINILEQKALYDTLHGIYKKAIQKALQSKSSSRRLIEVLQEFTNENVELSSKDS
ncbi:20028_t:CDS:2 [Cetraspora pellucida]|uniref:20028_t:CDS:1 n=1 Tax=Cetraspora pellucida TaxID=1433469 RepID=A0A9N9GV01_9GLOM|nr:20028_t:CDS:2 [Cetraspora pellucida]